MDLPSSKCVGPRLLLASGLAVASLIVLVVFLSDAVCGNRLSDRLFIHADVLRESLAKDGRFTDVRLMGTTALGIDIMGSVKTDADLSALKSIVSDSKPPVKVICSVYVGAPGRVPESGPPPISWIVDPAR